MERRLFLHTLGACAMATSPWVGAAPGSADKVQNLSDALHWLDQLQKAPGVKTTGTWPLVAILEHMAQSIEMSMQGFVQPKSALFQNTIGAAAFTVFKWRGAMSHTLSDPIPGAPVLTTTGDWQPAALRLHRSIEAFNASKAPLKPHFAYGTLSKADFALAHTLHIANHQDEISVNQLA